MKILKPYQLKKFKRFRRQLFQHVAAKGKHLHSRSDPGLDIDFSINRILIAKTVKSLGNLLGLTSLLSELEKRFPGSEVDIITSTPMTQELYRNFGQIGRIYQLPRVAFWQPVQYFKEILSIRRRTYDLVINPSAFSNSGRFLSWLARSTNYIAATPAGTDDSVPRHFAKQPVYLLRRHLSDSSKLIKEKSPPLGIRLSQKEANWGANVLQSITTPKHRKNGRTIALFTNATGAKCYSEQWWAEFYGQLSEKLHWFNFVEILPADGHSRLSFRIPTFYSSDIRKVGAVISATDAFIGADSGIMHLASAVHTHTIGLFSASDPEFWAPFGTGQCTFLRAGQHCRQAAEEVYAIVSTRFPAPDKHPSLQLANNIGQRSAM